MKKYIISSIIIAFTLSGCYAQNIIPVEKVVDYIDNPDLGLKDDGVTEVRDINNKLTPFVGVWKGVYENNNYEFRVVKKTEDDGELKEDILLMRYKITNASGAVIENTLSLPDNDVLIINGYYLSRNGSYVLSYVGRDDCGQNGSIYISTYGINNSRMRFGLYVEGGFDPENCVEEAQQVIPKKIELTKQ